MSLNHSEMLSFRPSLSSTRMGWPKVKPVLLLSWLLFYAISHVAGQQLNLKQSNWPRYQVKQQQQTPDASPTLPNYQQLSTQSSNTTLETPITLYHRMALVHVIFNDLYRHNMSNYFTNPGDDLVSPGLADSFRLNMESEPVFGNGINLSLDHSGGGDSPDSSTLARLINASKISSSPFTGSPLPSVLASVDASPSEDKSPIATAATATVYAQATSVAAANNSGQPRPFFGDFFFAFESAYWPVHCILCLVICTLGIFANVTNIIVLTRPNMITAVNTILCAIAFTDLIVEASNIPYLFHELSDQSDPASYFSYGWAVYILFHAHCTVTAHTISIWLTCLLATWRYCVVCSSSTQRNWSVALATRSIVCVILLVPGFCIPNYMSFAIVSEVAKQINDSTTALNPNSSESDVLYKVNFSNLAEESKLFRISHFWIFSCLTKIFPCILLTFFTTVLIKKLLEARERRLRLNAYGKKGSDFNNNTLANLENISRHGSRADVHMKDLNNNNNIKCSNGEDKLDAYLGANAGKLTNGDSNHEQQRRQTGSSDCSGQNSSHSQHEQQLQTTVMVTIKDPIMNPRGLSLGSTTLAPMQTTKLQAARRQLNQNETTTRLLIAVIIVFLICEFPAGILAALCAIFGQDFFDNVYQPMGYLTDLLALINSSVNFLLYCFMSQQFRATFYRVVLRCPEQSVQ